MEIFSRHKSFPMAIPYGQTFARGICGLGSGGRFDYNNRT